MKQDVAAKEAELDKIRNEHNAALSTHIQEAKVRFQASEADVRRQPARNVRPNGLSSRQSLHRSSLSSKRHTLPLSHHLRTPIPTSSSRSVNHTPKLCLLCLQSSRASEASTLRSSQKLVTEMVRSRRLKARSRGWLRSWSLAGVIRMSLHASSRSSRPSRMS